MYQQILNEILAISRQMSVLADSDNVTQLKVAYIHATALWARLARVETDPRQAA